MNEIKPLFECPVSLETFKKAVTNSCGHTIDQESVELISEKQFNCPLCRKPIEKEKMVPNLLVNDLLKDKEFNRFVSEEPSKITQLFLKGHHKTPAYEGLICCITKKPIIDGVRIPSCKPKHVFSRKGITKWYESRQVCPFDNRPFDIRDLKFDAESVAIAAKNYPVYLEQINTLNKDLRKTILESPLKELRHTVDHYNIMDSLAQKLVCPIQKELMTTPVLAPCGHTFDDYSFQEGKICPVDNTKLSVDKRINNRVIKDLLQLYKAHADSLKLEEDVSGAFLYLESETTIKGLIDLAQTLDFYGPKPSDRSYPSVYNLKKFLYSSDTLTKLDSNSTLICNYSCCR